ncbi:SDR family NAD(P)-dependent oxidoreductase, partial [Kitasatospora indigofera]|uniref:SDR family NAD(P)-dependent oxidoreductase n=1 Tax=Kitasatospora indigofera TaxID=67307 RepID=UPI00366502A4
LVPFHRRCARGAWGGGPPPPPARAGPGRLPPPAAEFGRLDILVNNAGAGVLGPVEELSAADVDRVLQVNVRAPFLAAQAVLRHMAEGGRIITIGSCMSERSAFAGGSLYGMSKSALNGLTRSLARELGPRGITANLVQPGPIDTEMNPADGPAGELQRSLTALGRFGQPSEVAAMVAHLAGEGGRYVTGSAILVDGGYAA